MTVLSCNRVSVITAFVLVLARADYAHVRRLQIEPNWTWSDATTDGGGSISRDGHQLTFVNWATGDLAIRDLASGTNRILTNRTDADAGQYPGESFFSPDGKQIGYNWYTAGGLQIRVISTDGGNPTIIDEGRNGSYWLQGWTPDGRGLLVIRRMSNEQVGEIGFLKIADRAFRAVGKAAPVANARLSPDGSRIVLSELSDEDPTQTDLRIIETTSGKSRVLLAGPDEDHDPGWSADGNGIYFLSDRGGRAGLWVLANSSAVPRRVADIPDGAARIIGVSANGGIFVGAYDVGGTDCYIGRVDWNTGEVSGLQKIANPPLRGARRAVFSDDGQEVAFLRRARGYSIRPGWQIPVVQHISDGQQRAYETALTVRDEPVWMPDGRSLLVPIPPGAAVGESAAQHWRFVRLDLTTGKYSDAATTSSPGQVRMAGVNDRELYYLINDPQSQMGSVMALSFKTKVRRELYRAPGALGDASVSRDASKLAITARQADGKTALQVIELATSAVTTIATLLPSGGAQLMWFPDGESLVASGRIDGVSGIWRLYLGSRPPTRLRIDGTDVTEVRVSMDGSWVAFTRRAQSERVVWSFRAR